MKKILAYILFICHSVSTLSAQVSDTTQQSIKSEVRVISKVLEGKVKLRWGPTNEAAWLYTKDKGFNLYRAEFTDILPIGADYHLYAENLSIPSAADVAVLVEDPSVGDYIKMVGLTTYGEWQTVKAGQSSNENWGKRSQELESRYLAFMFACDMSFEAAALGGYAFIDENIEANKNYAYRIEIANDSIYTPTYKVVRAGNISKTTSPQFSQTSEFENKVVLQWYRDMSDKYFTAYHIEKSKSGSTWQRLTEQPYINPVTDDLGYLEHITFSDSVANYDAHFYRVIGIDAFGDESPPSEQIKLMGRDRTPPIAPSVDSAYLTRNQDAIKLMWHFDEKSADLASIVIKKGPQPEGPFSPIYKASKVEVTYLDTKPSLTELQYFQVCAVDTAGNEACSAGQYAFFDDNVAPNAPHGLTGKIDSNGVVTLHWHLGEEEDLLGYYVQAGNGKERVFASLTNKPVRDTMWRDTITLHTLTEEIYYRVNAVDLRKNYSQFSEIIRLAKPDTIPPRPSVFKKYKVRADHISLDYALSSSSDISKVILLKKNLKSGEIFEIALQKGSSNYLDKDIAPNSKYIYDLITFDDADHQTPSPQPLQLQTKNDKHRHKVLLSYEKKDQKVTIRWSEAYGEVDFVKLYRGKKEAAMITYKSIKEGSTVTTDIGSVGGRFLKVKIYYKDGSKSDFSNTIEVL